MKNLSYFTAITIMVNQNFKLLRYLFNRYFDYFIVQIMNFNYTKQTQQNPHHHHYLHILTDQDLLQYQPFRFFIFFYFLSFQNYLLFNNLTLFIFLQVIHFLKCFILFKNIELLHLFLNHLQII